MIANRIVPNRHTIKIDTIIIFDNRHHHRRTVKIYLVRLMPKGNTTNKILEISLPILGQILTDGANMSIGYVVVPIESIVEPLLQPFRMFHRPFDAWTTTNF